MPAHRRKRVSTSSSTPKLQQPTLGLLHLLLPNVTPCVDCCVTHTTQVESILKPVRGIRDAQRRAGITPTNHSRHNIQAVKEQSRLNALQKAQEQDERILAATSGARSKGTTAGRAAGGVCRVVEEQATEVLAAAPAAPFLSSSSVPMDSSAPGH